MVRNRRYLGVASLGDADLHTRLHLIDRGSLAAVARELPALDIWTGWIAFAIFIRLAATGTRKVKHFSLCM